MAQRGGKDLHNFKNLPRTPVGSYMQGRRSKRRQRRTSWLAAAHPRAISGAEAVQPEGLVRLAEVLRQEPPGPAAPVQLLPWKADRGMYPLRRG